MPGRTFPHNGFLYEVQPDGSARKVAPVQQGIPANPIKVAEAQANIAQSGAAAQKNIAEAQNIPLQGAKITRDLRQTPISEDDSKRIDAMRQLVGAMPETLQMANEAASVIDRFQTGPNRANIVNSAVPPVEGGWIDNIKPAFNAWLNGVKPQDITDFKAIKRLQNKDILNTQIAQKGPQTESDAVRMGMTAVSPDKPTSLNARVIGDAIFSGLMAQQKPSFYTEWANKHGSLGALDNGKSVDQAWAETMAHRQQRFNSDPRIRRLDGPISRGLPPGWKIERAGN